jgi:hypothetical protein
VVKDSIIMVDFNMETLMTYSINSLDIKEEEEEEVEVIPLQ